MPKSSRPLKRKVHYNDSIFSYEIGKLGVRIRTPDNKKTVYVRFDKIKNPNFIEGKERNPTDITPAIVLEYIQATCGELDGEPLWRGIPWEIHERREMLKQMLDETF